jgi:hypothetical protein
MKNHCLALIIMLFSVSFVSIGAAGVDWGGSYGNSFSGTLNQGLGTAVTPSGDYTFDGNSDRAYRIPFGTGYTPSADSRYLAPDGKTGPLYTGMMLVNHSSTTAPTNAGIYRWSAGTSPNQLQKTNPTQTGDYSTMSMSVSYFAKKADFLNGLDSVQSLGFEDDENGARVSMSALRIQNSGQAAIAFIVQEGSEWYAALARTSGAAADWAGTVTLNPYQAAWYAFDPAANQLLNTNDMGTVKAGSTFTNITAFGITGQIVGYNGTVANSQKIDFTEFSAGLRDVTGSTQRLGLYILIN